MSKKNDKEKSFSELVGDDVTPIETEEQHVPAPGVAAQNRPLPFVTTEESSPNYLADYLDDTNMVGANESFEHRSDGIQISVFKRFVCGFYEAGREIDLHNHTIKEAHSVIWRTIDESINEGHRCIMIVHGKGVRSQPPAQLKSYVRQVLKQHKDVFAYCCNEKLEGGTGATHVWLRKSKAAKAENRERHQSRRG